MLQRFKDRKEAGRLLAMRLQTLAARDDVVVLALPRGGVPVAHEVAAALRAPLDVMVVRKLGAPYDEELAVGALGPTGLRVLNHALLEDLAVPPRALDQIVAQEQRELERRERLYRHGRPALDLRGKIVLLVDDGIATGATMRVAVATAREAGARRIVVVAPVMAREAYFVLRPKADEVCTLQIPKEFRAVGEFYADFAQESDAHVVELLSEPAGRTAS
ncbi:MAG: phosphoribosyltransferase [Opitutus sp.]|nr:phosphoribosyltransferase [Opitutus sp.]